MKDYSMNKEERDRFILGYDDESSPIIVNFANGEELPLPNNDKNKQILLKKMNEQVDNSDKFQEETRKRKIKFNNLVLVSMFGAFVTIFFPLAEFGKLTSMHYIVAAILASFGGIFIRCSIKSIALLNDLKKNREFRKIEDKLNENIRKANENVLANTSKKMREIVEKTPENKPVFNINSFNYVPYSDIQQVMDNIKRNEDFGFDYSDTQVKEQGKTRKRRR